MGVERANAFRGVGGNALHDRERKKRKDRLALFLSSFGDRKPRCGFTPTVLPRCGNPPLHGTLKCPTPPYRELRGGKEKVNRQTKTSGNDTAPQLNRIFYGKRLTSGKKCVKIEKQKKKKI
jgi:hypothetical protein